MPERVLVTGGTGFVGSNLVSALVETGYEVGVLSRRAISKGTLPQGVSVLSGDVCRPETLPSFEAYDSVVHLAGIVSVGQSIDDPKTTVETNTLGTQHVFECARKDGISDCIYLSSGAVYGNPEYLPIDESHPTQCFHPYAASKLAGEHIAESYAHAYGMSVGVLRGFTLYGPGQQSDNLVPSVVSKLADGEDEIVLGNLEPTRDFTYIADLVTAIIRVLEESIDTYEVFNIGSGNETTVREMVNEIVRTSGQEVSVVSEDTGRSSDVEISRMVADTEKLEQLGWTAEYDLQTGVKETLNHVNDD